MFVISAFLFLFDAAPSAFINLNLCTTNNNIYVTNYSN